jgi:hypothetical protein
MVVSFVGAMKVGTNITFGAFDDDACESDWHAGIEYILEYRVNLLEG